MGVLTIVAAAESSRISSMFVFFFIALLIVSPFGYKRVSAVLRERRMAALPASDDGESGPPTSRAEHPERPADDLANVIAAIATAGHELTGAPDEDRLVALPAQPLVEGRPASPAVVSALIDDAVRRSGLTADIVVDDNGQRVVHLRTA